VKRSDVIGVRVWLGGLAGGSGAVFGTEEAGKHGALGGQVLGVAVYAADEQCALDTGDHDLGRISEPPAAEMLSRRVAKVSLYCSIRACARSAFSGKW